MIYGYARVSTDGQSLDAQVAELKARVVRRFSGEDQRRTSDRKELARGVAKLGKGDSSLYAALIAGPSLA